MKNMPIRLSALLCLCCGRLIGAGIQSQEIIQNVEKKLSEKQTVTARFEEQYVWKLTGEKQTIKGEFNLKGENRFRITTEDQLIVSDGKTLWTYSKPAGRVLVDKVENAENDWLPQKLFLKTRKEFRHRLSGEATFQARKCYVVDFDAEKDDSYITKMKVWVDAETWLPAKIEQTDISRNQTIYTLSEIRAGLELEDSLFEFKAPEGAEIIDLR
jgi:chaperone LolA